MTFVQSVEKCKEEAEKNPGWRGRVAALHTEAIFKDVKGYNHNNCTVSAVCHCTVYITHGKHSNDLESF